MKKYITVFLLLLTPLSSYSSVTITDPDEEISGDVKVCIYSGHNTVKTITIPNERNCPYAKTFED